MNRQYRRPGGRPWRTFMTDDSAILKRLARKQGRALRPARESGGTLAGMGNRLYIDCDIASSVATADRRRRSAKQATTPPLFAGVDLPSRSPRQHRPPQSAYGQFLGKPGESPDLPRQACRLALLRCRATPFPPKVVRQRCSRTPRGATSWLRADVRGVSHGNVWHAGGRTEDFSSAEHRIHPRDRRSGAPYVRQRAIVITPRRSHGHLGGLVER